jgi:hypothetical protein
MSLGGASAAASLSMLKEEDMRAATAMTATGGVGAADEKSGLKAPSQSLLKVVLEDYRAEKDRTSRLLYALDLDSSFFFFSSFCC